MEHVQNAPAKLYARKKVDKGIYERIGKDGKKSYQVIVRISPHQPESESFDRLTDARKWQEKTKAEIRDGKYFKTAEAKKHTLGEVIDRYIQEILPKRKPKSLKKQAAQLLWWKKQIGNKLLSDVTAPLIVEQRDKLGLGITRLGRSRSPATVTRYLAALSHALSVATKEWGWLDDFPMRKVSKPPESRGRVRFLSDEERSKLLFACKESSHPYLYIAVVLSLSSGFRKSELLNLRWSDVDMQRKRILLHETKNGERRTVHIAGLAWEMLRDLEKKRRIDSLLLFPSKDPKKPACLRNVWEKCLEIAGIDNFRWHDLRHCCASYLAMNGATLTDIAEILGHKTIAMSRKYSHLSETHVAEVISQMNEKIFG
jgi:integrase